MYMYFKILEIFIVIATNMAHSLKHIVHWSTLLVTEVQSIGQYFEKNADHFTMTYIEEI